MDGPERASPPPEGAFADEGELARSIVDTVRDPLLVLDAELRVIGASGEFYRVFGVAPAETLGRRVYDLGDRQWDIPALRTLLEDVLPRRATFRDFEVEHAFAGVGRKVMLLNARRLRRGPGEAELILLAIEDATARRDAEEARREAETRFTEMVRNVRDHSIFLTDPEGVITSWNVAAERVIGLTEAEALGKHFSIIFTPEDLQAGLPEWELRTARQEGRAEDERWHVKKGGERFWALGIVTPLRDADGRLSGFSKILRDMTDRKRLDVALRQSEERLRLALAAAGMGTWSWDVAADRHTSDANLNRLLGLEPAETTRPLAGFLARVHPEDRDRVAAGFARSADQGRSVDAEFRVVWPDGSVRWVRDKGDVFELEGGTVMTGACVDVTERRLAEEALRASEERLRLVLASAADYAIFAMDRDRKVTVWSPGAERTFRVTAAEMVGRSGDLIFTDDDRAAGAPAAEAAGALRDGRASDDRWHVRGDGSRFYASGVMTPLGPGGALGFVKVLRDLTDRKRMEDELRDAHGMLRAAHDELEARVAARTAELAEVVDRLREEIRERERAEAARTELQRRLSSAQEHERKRIARDLHDSVGQLMVGLSLASKAGRVDEVQRITDQLVRQIRELTIRLRPTELDDLGVKAALEQLVVEWSRRTGVEAEFAAGGLTGERLPAEVETTLFRVVQEALTNVAKHARATWVSVVVGRAAGTVSAVVEDDGVGFDPETSGRGRFGLVGMRERVALVGGEVEVESSTEGGTTIIARLPASGTGA